LSSEMTRCWWLHAKISLLNLHSTITVTLRIAKMPVKNDANGGENRLAFSHANVQNQHRSTMAEEQSKAVLRLRIVAT